MEELLLFLIFIALGVIATAQILIYDILIGIRDELKR